MCIIAWDWDGMPLSSLAVDGSLLLSLLPGSPFSFQFLGLKHAKSFLLELSNMVAERYGNLRKNIQGKIYVHTEFCKTMSMRQIK